MRCCRPPGGRKHALPTASRRKPPASSPGIPFGPFVPPSPKRPPPPSAIGLQPCTAMFVASSSSPGPSHHLATDESLTSPQPSTPPATKGSASVVCFIERPADFVHPDSEPAVDNTGPAPSSAVILGDCSLASVSLGTLPITGIRPTKSLDHRSEPSIAFPQPPRTMKSLGSLLDNFREIARSATQVSLKSVPIQVSRPRPRVRPRTAQAKLQTSGAFTHSHSPARARAPPAGLSESAHHPRSTYMRAASLALPPPSLSLRRLQDRVSCASISALGHEKSHLGALPDDLGTQEDELVSASSGAYMVWMDKCASLNIIC